MDGRNLLGEVEEHGKEVGSYACRGTARERYDLVTIVHSVTKPRLLSAANETKLSF